MSQVSGQRIAPAHLSKVQAAVLDWYARHRRDLPWRKSRDPYAILVSEVMLQQTQVERVVPKYQEFMARFPDVHALAASGSGDVIRAWAPLGYNGRAIRLWRTARRVVAERGGNLPEDQAALRSFEGIGEYTAAAVACFAFGQNAAVADTNVRRVLGRVFRGGGHLSPRDATALAWETLPEDKAPDWYQALMDLGAMVCDSRRPLCQECPAHSWCLAAGRAGAVAEEPAVYRTGKRKGGAPFKGSSRYYRGRALDQLRLLAEGDSMPLRALGEAIRPGFMDDGSSWIEGLIAGLGRDGLVCLKETKDGVGVSLP